MKIVHIITRMILGGAQENTLLTCRGLAQRGHDVTLITGPALGPEGRLIDQARQDHYQVIQLDSLQRAINPVTDLRCYFQLKKLIRQRTPDIVHTHSAKAGILGRWAGSALRKKNDTTVCCRPLRTFRQAQQTCIARPRIVHTIHGLSFHPYQWSGWNTLYKTIERKTAPHTDAFISVAQAMTDQSLAAGIGSARQYTKIVSGMQTQSFLNAPDEQEIQNIRRQWGFDKDHLVIATLARLFHLKGHEFIIQSAQTLSKKFPNARWLFIGDGLLRKKIEDQLDRENLREKFHLTGLVPPEQIPPLLHASDILAHCSLREGLARALPQAMLCAKPVVSFDVDGAREVVQNDQTGFLVPPKDISQLTDTISRLLADGSLRQRLGQTAREQCRTQFDDKIMVEKIEQLYLHLLANSGR